MSNEAKFEEIALRVAKAKNGQIVISTATANLIEFLFECHRRGMPISEKDFNDLRYALAVSAEDAESTQCKVH